MAVRLPATPRTADRTKATPNNKRIDCGFVDGGEIPSESRRWFGASKQTIKTQSFAE